MKRIFHFLAHAFIVGIASSCSDDDDNLKSNQLSQEEAYEKVKKKLSKFSLDEIDIYVYPQTLPANAKVENPFDNEIKTPSTELRALKKSLYRLSP